MHSGWGVLVAVSGNANSPGVIMRKRIVAMDPTIPGAKQPYHHAASLESRQLGLSDSETYLANCAAVSERMASAAVAEVVRELEGRHYRIVGSAVLLAAGRPFAVSCENSSVAPIDSHRGRRILSQRCQKSL
jgi:hypothetical protein